MVERIQYVLILLLFVLTGSLDGTSFRTGTNDLQPVLTESTRSDASDAVRNQLSAWTHSCESQAESPIVTPDQKVVVRQRAAWHDAVESAFDARVALNLHDAARPGDAVDDYVISLGRLLI